jgi:hypothetical protein
MMWFGRSTHLEDATLLLAAEGEASPRAAAHLRACAACRNRQALLTDYETEIALPSEPAGSDAARERLLASLIEEPKKRGAWFRPRTYLQMAVVVALLLVAVTWRQAYSPLQDRMAAYEETGPEPNHELTPGAVRPIAMTELCSLNDADLDPQVSADKQRAVFAAYGLNEKAARAYQVDYLINPQLGGNDDTANLWPEPYHATVWNATAKDALETRLHGMVCSGDIRLEQAQQELATDWIAAYKKYFHTSRPVNAKAGVPAFTLSRTQAFDSQFESRRRPLQGLQILDEFLDFSRRELVLERRHGNLAVHDAIGDGVLGDFRGAVGKGGVSEETLQSWADLGVGACGVVTDRALGVERCFAMGGCVAHLCVSGSRHGESQRRGEGECSIQTHLHIPLRYRLFAG